MNKCFFPTGNNWGNCPNGTGAIGCGPQEEFRACADIKIGKGGTDFEDVAEEVPETPEVTTAATTEPAIVTTTPEQSYNPFGALMLSLGTFLLICLILSLLFFHYYHFGSKIKDWLRGEKSAESKGETGGYSVSSKQVPLPPPRTKRANGGVNFDDRLRQISSQR